MHPHTYVANNCGRLSKSQLGKAGGHYKWIGAVLIWVACCCCAGVYLSKDLMSIAGHALKANITTLGPLVLPISEQLLFFLNLVARKVCTTLTPPPLHPQPESSCATPTE
jgi:hypothetical protein